MAASLALDPRLAPGGRCELALRYDALLVGVYTERLGPHRMRITMEPPLDVPRTGDADADVKAIMTAINARVESWVRARPDQWLWLHKRWRLTPKRPIKPPRVMRRSSPTQAA